MEKPVMQVLKEQRHYPMVMKKNHHRNHKQQRTQF
jgi:hypothetical protein